MNMCCERCRREDICLCDLPDDPTAAAVEILDAARANVLADLSCAPEHDEQTAELITRHGARADERDRQPSGLRRDRSLISTGRR